MGVRHFAAPRDNGMSKLVLVLYLGVSMSVRIPVTEAAIIRALLHGAKSYNYTVTEDDFDDHDNEAPGHYVGVTVEDEIGAKWNEGIDACQAAGIATRSREGLELRYEIMHGNRDLPTFLRDWLDDQEGQARAKEAAAAEREAKRLAYLANFEGFTNIQADEYTSEFWPLTARDARSDRTLGRLRLRRRDAPRSRTRERRLSAAQWRHHGDARRTLLDSLDSGPSAHR